MKIVDGPTAIRIANHLQRRLAAAGVDPEDLAMLGDLRDWVRGMVALDIMAAHARGDRSDTS